MTSVSLDLIIFSGAVIFGIVFLLWVLFHLTIESRQARTRRRHTFRVAMAFMRKPLPMTIQRKYPSGRHKDRKREEMYSSPFA